MKIGFFSSSTPITAISSKRFARAKKFLESKGADLVAGSLTNKRDYYRSGSIHARADELNSLIHDDKIDILMATIGGLNTNEILKYIDFNYLQNHPKTIVGYSDTTAFLLAVTVKAPACRVLYGPALVASFGEFSPIVDQTWVMFEKIIQYEQPVTILAPKLWTDEQLNWDEYTRDKVMSVNHWQYIQTPILEGKILGGNLDTMAGIIGSSYFPKFNDDNILLIEDAEKDASIVEKNFAMLDNAGVFDQVKGIVLGKHAMFDDLGTKRKPIDILLEVLDGKSVPIIYDYDSAHTVPMLTTPINAQVRIDAIKKEVTFFDF